MIHTMVIILIMVMGIILIMVTAIILTMVMVITPMDITTEAITIEDTMITIIV